MNASPGTDSPRHAQPTPVPLGRPRLAAAAFVTALASLVWTHALAGMLRPALRVAPEHLADASLGLTLVALVAGVAAGLAPRGRRRALVTSLVVAGPGTIALAALYPATAPLAFAPLPAAAAAATLGAWLAPRLPAELDRLALDHPRVSIAWLGVAALAVLQVARLGTYMNDADSDWFLSTRNPFFAKHECANAYVYGAELHRDGEPNVYDAAHYPGLNPDAKPHTGMVGMAPEDPFQYPPPFLLLPTAAIALTSDYGAIRLGWFGLNFTLCLAAVLALAAWVGGRLGLWSALLTPALLLAFPVLHDFQYGQFHFAAVALAVLGMIAFHLRRTALGGALLAAAILAKVFPAVLLPLLLGQRRLREVSFTIAAGAAFSAVAWLVLGPAPFVAFVEYQLPRLADGSAFAFGEAWPELAPLVTAGNQGIYGMVEKLAAAGLPGFDASLGSAIARAFGLALLGAAGWVGTRSREVPAVDSAVTWLGLLGLGSLVSTGAWADYVPLTCVWLLAWVLPRVWHDARLRAAALVVAALQLSLVGTMPLGTLADPSWMLPLSLVSALAMLLTCAAAVWLPARREARTSSAPRIAGRRSSAPAIEAA